jgi:hypothetical protein
MGDFYDMRAVRACRRCAKVEVMFNECRECLDKHRARVERELALEAMEFAPVVKSVVKPKLRRMKRNGIARI